MFIVEFDHYAMGGTAPALLIFAIFAIFALFTYKNYTSFLQVSPRLAV